MQKIIYPIIVIALVLTCSCCKTSKKNVKSNNFPLINTQWMLESIEGEEIRTDYALRPFIKFDSSYNVTGSLGCNSLFGTYSVNKKDKMTIHYTGSTKRLCQKMSVERNFINALKKDINRYEIKGDKLILYSEDKEVISFKGVDLDTVE